MNGDSYGLNMVTFAAGIALPQYLKLLLEYGGDPNSRRTNANALQEAIKLSSRDGYVNYYILLAAGADPEMYVAENSGTIVDGLWASGQYDKICELLERGYDYRLDKLAWAMQHDARLHENLTDFTAEGRQQIRFGEKVISLLKQRGVVFPLTQEPSTQAEITADETRKATNDKKPGGLLMNP